MNPTIITLKITIKGKVQAVGFRFFCQQEAAKHHIKGTVQNLMNGDVEVIAQGTQLDVAHFITFLKQGPLHAKIANVYAEPVEKPNKYSSFQIY